MFFPDISAELLKRRKVFDGVKRELASLSISDLRYRIVHPAKLLITHNRKRHVFDKAAAMKREDQQSSRVDSFLGSMGCAYCGGGGGGITLGLPKHIRPDMTVVIYMHVI
ncbi:hypothetical protein F7725_017799 [Dissostichus mawsoni]|uniref:Uncharacterized protein n=1 Tax=Dissostichus mawsoni TaxID=36200 RepID=A0A7J5XPS9_DISMA|nr:hypothetical protein F7725_017799 [Dissostichus mawsoni]